MFRGTLYLVILALLVSTAIVYGGCPKCEGRDLLCISDKREYVAGEEVTLTIYNIGDGREEIEYVDAYLLYPGGKRYLGKIDLGVVIERGGEYNISVKLPRDLEPGDEYSILLVSSDGREIYSNSFSIKAGEDLGLLLGGITTLIIALAVVLLIRRR